MSDMTPQQAADEVERVMARTMPLRNHKHLRVLIDCVRAAAPEGRDLAAEVSTLRALTTDLDRLGTRARGAMRGEMDGDEYSREVEDVSESMEALADRLAALTPAPSVAAPPRGDDEDEDPLTDIADQVDGVVAAWDVFDPERNNLAELRGAVFRLRRLAAAPGTVRDPERAT